MPLNERQRLVINRLLEGFEGKANDVEVGGADEELAARHCGTSSSLWIGGGEAKRAFEAMMPMKKIDIATIEAARRG